MTVPKGHHTILAVAAAGLPGYMQEGAPALHSMNRDSALGILSAAGAWFGPRGVLEEEPRFRQIIPYVIIRCKGRILTYTRPDTSGESRLASKSSIGFGGHIDVSDYAAAAKRVKEPGPVLDIAGVLEVATLREVVEEVGIQAAVNGRSVLGLLTDNTTPVDRVHIGFVQVWDVVTRALEVQADEIAEVSWKTPSELVEIRDTLENWSRISFDHLLTRW